MEQAVQQGVILIMRYACNKEARNYYLSELMMCFNFVFNEMCHGTGSAAGCDFNNEEE